MTIKMLAKEQDVDSAPQTNKTISKYCVAVIRRAIDLVRNCSGPIGAVQRAIADSFRNVCRTDFIATFEIRNRAADFENAIVGARGEADALHGALEHSFTLLVDLAMQTNHARRHRG